MQDRFLFIPCNVLFIIEYMSGLILRARIESIRILFLCLQTVFAAY